MSNIPGWELNLQWRHLRVTLPKTNSSPLKIGHHKRKFVFQPPFFRGELLVSGKVTTSHINSSSEFETHQMGLKFPPKSIESWVGSYINMWPGWNFSKFTAPENEPSVHLKTPPKTIEIRSNRIWTNHSHLHFWGLQNPFGWIPGCFFGTKKNNSMSVQKWRLGSQSSELRKLNLWPPLWLLRTGASNQYESPEKLTPTQYDNGGESKNDIVFYFLLVFFLFGGGGDFSLEVWFVCFGCLHQLIRVQWCVETRSEGRVVLTNQRLSF